MAGMYIHIEEGRSYIAVGMRSPSAKVRKNIRKHIADNYQQFQTILEKRALRKTFGDPHGERTNKLLKVYKDHPARKLLKYKSLYFYHSIPDKVVISQDFEDYLMTDRLIAKSFIDFLHT